MMSMSEAETLSVGAERVLAAEFPESDVTQGFPVVRGGSREVYARRSGNGIVSRGERLGEDTLDDESRIVLWKWWL